MTYLLPQAGDWVIMPSEKMERISKDLGDKVQTSCGRFGCSFHLGSDGYADFSGGHNAAINKSNLADTNEIQDGKFWTFNNGEVKGHNGVHFVMPVKVWKVTPQAVK